MKISTATHNLKFPEVIPNKSHRADLKNNLLIFKDEGYSTLNLELDSFGKTNEQGSIIYELNHDLIIRSGTYEFIVLENFDENQKLVDYTIQVFKVLPLKENALIKEISYPRLQSGLFPADVKIIVFTWFIRNAPLKLQEKIGIITYEELEDEHEEPDPVISKGVKRFFKGTNETFKWICSVIGLIILGLIFSPNITILVTLSAAVLYAAAARINWHLESKVAPVYKNREEPSI